MAREIRILAARGDIFRALLFVPFDPPAVEFRTPAASLDVEALKFVDAEERPLLDTGALVARTIEWRQTDKDGDTINVERIRDKYDCVRAEVIDAERAAVARRSQFVGQAFDARTPEQRDAAASEAASRAEELKLASEAFTVSAVETAQRVSEILSVVVLDDRERALPLEEQRALLDRRRAEVQPQVDAELAAHDAARVRLDAAIDAASGAVVPRAERAKVEPLSEEASRAVV